MCGEHSADAPRIAHQVGKVYSNGACGTSLIAVPPGKLHPHRGPWLDGAAKHRFGAAGADTQQENMVHKVANKVTWLLLGLPSYAVCFCECVLADEVALLIVLVEDIQHVPRVFLRCLHAPTIPGDGKLSCCDDTHCRDCRNGTPEFLDMGRVERDSAADARWQRIENMR